MRLALAATLLVGCGGGGDAVDAPPAADAAGPDAFIPVGNTTVRGRLVDGVQPSIPLEGVSVRVVGTGLVTTSNAAGEFVLAGVPAGEVVLHFDLADYFPQASRVFTIGDGGTYDYEGYGIVGMASEAITIFFADLLDKTIDPTKGHIIASATEGSGGLAGATFSVEGTTCDAPIYLNEKSAPDPTLTSTSSRGLVLFFNCAVAERAQVNISHATATDCEGVGADAPARLVVHTYAARMTYAGTYLCAEP